MLDLIVHIEACLKKYNAEKVIVGCSAGLDSTVLLHACAKLDIPTEIAHVNYQLRGQESNKDQQFLEALAKSLSLPIHVHPVDLNKQLKNGGNLQELARNERYQFFQSLRKTDQHTFVLLAHHAEDQTETFFMNLARDSGILGLAAMPEKRSYFLRPLLSFSKEDLRSYAQRNRIEWREDSSNSSLKYTRNQWRNSVLPGLRESLPSLDESVGILARLFQEKQQEVQSKVQGIFNEIIEQHSIALETFQALDSNEIIELCRQLGQPIGIAETWSKLRHKGTGIELQPNQLSPFHKLIYDGDSYSFLLNTAEVKPILHAETVKALPPDFNKTEVYLDKGLILGVLQIRKVQTGDRIHPIGMNGSRLVSDVISDAKLTSIQKQTLHVLVDDQHVLWVPQLCVSRKAIASNKSKQLVKVSLA
jgi:tRNA(Ile)-lysidine synthase